VAVIRKDSNSRETKPKTPERSPEEVPPEDILE
jgi:hypothetical protein